MSKNWIELATITISCLACISSFVVAFAGILISLSISKRQNSTLLEISKIESKIALQVSATQVGQQKLNLLYEPRKEDLHEIMSWIEDAKIIQDSNDKFHNMRSQRLPIDKDEVVKAYKFFRGWDKKFQRIERFATFYDPSKEHYSGLKWGSEPLPSELGILVGLFYLDVYSNTEREHNEIFKSLVGKELLDDEEKRALTEKADGFAAKLYQATLDSLLRVREKLV